MKIKYLALLILITSCSPTIKDFHQYKKHFLSRSSFMPNKSDLKRKTPKVVVFNLDEGKNKIANQANLGKSLANNIENILAQNRLAKLINRNIAKKLRKEISLIEMKKTGSYKGPQVADYAISGDIADASFASKYSSGSTYVNPKNFAIISIPPNFKYKASVAGNIKIYELPSLNIIRTIAFKGDKSRSENVRQSGGVSLGALQIGGTKADGAKRDDGLVRRAGRNALQNIQIEIKNIFAKRGYILEKRMSGKKAIFKINLGRTDGIKTGDKLEIISKNEVENPLSEEIEIENNTIAKAIITDKINSKNSWIILDDNDKANLIKLGDTAKIKYKRNKFMSFLRKIGLI